VWLPVLSIGLLIALVGISALTMQLDWRDWRIHLVAYLFVMVIVTGGAYLFSHSIFRVVEQKEGEILRRNLELATVNAVGEVINESLDLDEVLEPALTRVLEVTGADAGEVFLREEGAETLVMRAFQGRSPDAFREITRFRLNEGYPGWIAKTSEAIVVHDLVDDPRFLRGKVKERGFQSYAGVPLKSKGKVVGVMGVFAQDPGALTQEDVGLLETLGSQIGVAIENATLYAQLKTMTVMEERQRIAREMHDGLAQELGYLYLKIGELEVNPALSSLREDILLMKRVVAGAYEEVQQAIFGLKMMVSRGLGLIPTFAEYLHEFGEQTGITVKLRVADEAATRFSPHVEIQLIRIVQEALTNVRKHARAERATVSFEVDGDRAKVTIGDDGHGFDPEKAARPGQASFGLQTMRERAESAGGSFDVQSERGKGTRVIVWLARVNEEGSIWRQ
jgi:signal transduction histidine kinase